MSDRDRMELEGIVVDSNKGIFTVESDAGTRIMCTLSGKIQKNSVRILVEDRVKVEVSPYDLTKGRIVYRNK
jgi:translation initiation factor IF-1